MSTILLTFDVEDWFQVENFKQFIPFSSWQKFELRLEKSVHLLLDLLDSIKIDRINHRNQTNQKDQINQMNQINQKNQIDQIDQPSVSMLRAPCSSPLCPLRLTPPANIKGTFFVLGWVAERLPHLVREINNRGHEVASHGYNHKLCQEESLEDLKADLEKSKKLLEDITGTPIYGYRAPNFSIDENILAAIEEAGYVYDSSYNSYRLNKRYGQIPLLRNHNGSPQEISKGFYEIPISNLKVGNQVLHWGGGGYFRLIPIKIFNSGVHSILKQSGVYTFYLHPWEFDPFQPKLNGISNFLKFRHYYNLQKTSVKFTSFLNFFKKCDFLTCIDFLKRQYFISVIPGDWTRRRCRGRYDSFSS